jgi:hypothetical protein
MEIVSDEEQDDVGIHLESLNLNGSQDNDDWGSGEQYSKAVGDRTFQKFVRRIEQSPEQILRYYLLYC